MKKLVNYVAIAATAALIPFTASALEPMSNAAKKDITGQAGVSIIADDIQLETWTGETKYIDTESVDGGNGGAIVVGPSQSRIRIRAMAGGDFNTNLNADLQAKYGFQLTGLTDGTFQQAAPLSVNIGNCEMSALGVENNRQFLKDVLPNQFMWGQLVYGKASIENDPQTTATKESWMDLVMNDMYVPNLDLTIRGASYAIASGLWKYLDSENQDMVHLWDWDAGEPMFEKDANGDYILDANNNPIPVYGMGGDGTYAAKDVIGVQIEIPTLCVEFSAKTTTIGVAQLGEYDPADPSSLTAVNHGQNFITIEKGPSVMAFYTGTLEIVAH